MIKDSILDVNEYSFFISDSHARLHSVFNSFKKYRNLTARVDSHKNGGNIDVIDGCRLSQSSYSQLYYKVELKKHLLHRALYSELLCRLTILKLCVEEIIKCGELGAFFQEIEKLSLPSGNIQLGIEKLQKHSYFYLYPHFWQVFIYVFGGFILMCKKDEEYSMLSELTNIPVDEIDNALSAFDILFPTKNSSWLYDIPYTKIRMLRFMPIPFSGIGANFRRIIYSDGEDKCDYDNLKSQLPDDFTYSDILKFNNLPIEYLK